MKRIPKVFLSVVLLLSIIAGLAVSGVAATTEDVTGSEVSDIQTAAQAETTILKEDGTGGEKPALTEVQESGKPFAANEEDITAEAVVPDVEKNALKTADKAAEEPSKQPEFNVATKPVAAASVNQTVAIQSFDYSVADFSGPYTGQPQGISVWNPDKLTLLYSESADGPFDPVPITQTTPGKKTVFVRADGDSEVKSAKLEVTKADAVIRLQYAEGTEMHEIYIQPVYSGKLAEVDVIVEGAVNGEKLVYTLTEIAPWYNSPSTHSLPMGQNFTLSYKAADGVNANYNITLKYVNGTSVTSTSLTQTVSYMPRDLGIVYPDFISARYIYGDASIQVPVKDSLKLTGVLPDDEANVFRLYYGGQYTPYMWSQESLDFGTAADYDIDDMVPGVEYTTGAYSFRFAINGGVKGIADNVTVNGRYANRFGVYSFYIDPRPVSIVAGKLEKTYGDPDPILIAKEPDTVYGDTLDYKISREPGETVGQYAIKVGVDKYQDVNYEISSEDGTLTIKPRTLTLVGSSDARTYTGQEQSITAYKIEGLINGDKIVSGIDYIARGTDVGKYDGAFTIDADKLKIENIKGEDVTDCYVLEDESGALTIAAAPVYPENPVTPPTTIEPTGPPAPQNPAAVDITTPVVPASVVPPLDDEGIADRVNPIKTLADTQVPAGNLGTPAWSLLNLIMAIISIVAAIVLFIGIFTRRSQKRQEDEEEQEETSEKRKRLMALRIPAILTGLIPGILFLLLENMRLPMTWINRWTPLIGAFFLLNMVLVLVHFVIKKPEDKDAEYYSPQMPA